METVLGLLGLCVLIWFIFGMFKPLKAAPFLKQPSRLKIFGIFLGVFFILGLFAPKSEKSDTNVSQSTNSKSQTSAPEQKKQKEEKKADLEILETDTSNDGYVRYVVGTVRNNTKKTYGYVQVTINLYDASGAQVGSTLANVNNLEPSGIWKFKAPIMDDNVAKFKVKEVTGF